MNIEEKLIMLIEDNPNDVDLTLRALKKSNILNKVVVARDGEEAITMLLGDNRIIPQVILLDFRLPKIDGLEVLQRIRADERTKLLPVVILTTSKEEADIINGYKLGANSYVRKPVDFIQFSEAVKNLGLFWVLLNEPSPIH